MIRAAAAFLLIAGAAVAQRDPLYPTADCAALWGSLADFRASHALDSAPAGDARAVARVFRDAAVAAAGNAQAADARIAAARPGFRLLLESAILDGDRDSRDTYEWFADICQRHGEALGLQLR